jgi:hypothetical protein
MIDDFVGFPLKSDPEKPESLKFGVEPQSWESAAVQAARMREKFGKENPALFYMDYSWPKPGDLFKDWNHDLWAGTGRIAWPVPEVEDYMVWVVNEYIRRGLIDGLYVDDVSCGRTYSLAGTAYPFEGRDPPRRQGFNAMGFRRFCQRVWKLLDARDKDPHILAHMTYCFEIPALSFCMAAVNGEARMIGLGAKHDTMDAWRRDELRIMGNAPKWGFATFWKPTVEIQGAVPDAMAAWYYRQVRTLHANVMQADMWYLWHYPSARVILPSLYEFGMGDPELRFIPYWDNDGIPSVQAPKPDDIEVGVFHKPGRALVMVSNFAREDQDVALTVDAGKLFPGAQSVSWRDIDCSLEAPEDVVASAAEVRQAQQGIMSGELSLDAVGSDDTAVGSLEDMLEGVDPKEKERERLRLRVDGGRASFVVRKRDYRLLEATPVR